jgi:hypothetical protein
MAQKTYNALAKASKDSGGSGDLHEAFKWYGGSVYSQSPAPVTKTTQDPDDIQKRARFYLKDRTPAQVVRKLRGYPTDADKDVLGMAAAGEKDAASLDTGGLGHIDFFLTSLTARSEEKYQINEVMGDSYAAYFFGQKARVFRLQGTLLETVNDDQSFLMNELYNAVYRGTRMADLKWVVTLAYRSTLVEGVFLDFTETLNAELEMANSFACNFLVKKVTRRPGLDPTLWKQQRTGFAYQASLEGDPQQLNFANDQTIATII